MKKTVLLKIYMSDITPNLHFLKVHFCRSSVRRKTRGSSLNLSADKKTTWASLGFILFCQFDTLIIIKKSIHAFVRLFAQSLSHSFAGSIALSFFRSLIRSFVYSFIGSFARSFVCSFVGSFAHSLARSSARSIVRSI